MNSVSYIKFIVKSKPLSEETKIKLKKVGPHQPVFGLANTAQEFNTDYYKLATWLCGCPEKRAFFCYVCLVTDNTRSGLWIDGIITDNFEELKTRVENHQRSKRHMDNSLDYALIGSNIGERSKEWASTVIQHNEKVHDNQYVLSKLINCVKDQKVNFVEEMNKILNESCLCVTSKETICDELLEAIYAVCVGLIRKEIDKADYVSVVFDEATKSCTSDLIFLVRYELQGHIHERFLKFVEKSEEFSTVVLKELKNLDIDDTPNKLVSYSHDGLGLCCAQKVSEHSKITSLYERAKFIHSYTHKLDLIIERAASTYREVKIFFANLAIFSDFFSREKYVIILDEAAEKRLLRGTKVKWTFDTQTAFIVSLHKDSINECLNQIIQDETDRGSIAKAVALTNLLNDSDFNFWLDFFNKVFPNCDRLFNQLLRCEGGDVMNIRQYLEIFKRHIITLERGIDYQLNQSGENDAPPNKRQCKESTAIKEEITIEEIDLNIVKQEMSEEVAEESVNNERKRNEIAKSVCKIIINAVEDRFSYVDHLSMAALLQSSFFPKYEAFFPKCEVVQASNTHYLPLEQLTYELHTIYNRNELSKVESSLILLQYMYKTKLANIVPETFKLLKIICTMPMITDEPDRCFTTVTRVKELFRRVCQSRKNAFVMCSLEKGLMQRTPNFNDLVVKEFCKRNNRNTEFEYRRVC